MKPKSLLLRILGKKEGNQWTVMCLDFSLAAQADTYDEAHRLLQAQIHSYLKDIFEGPDREFAETLLRRRAPLRYWFAFYYFRFLQALRRDGVPVGHHLGCETMPLTVA